MPETRGTNDIFEAMSTTRAMRRLKSDPVPDELINKILQAAQWAPSGGNTQRWRFLVIKDPEIKKKVQVLLHAPIRRNGRAALRVERAAAGLRPRPLPAPARRRRI